MVDGCWLCVLRFALCVVVCWLLVVDSLCVACCLLVVVSCVMVIVWCGR